MKLSQQPTRTVMGRKVHWATVRDKGEPDILNQCPRHATTHSMGTSFCWCHYCCSHCLSRKGFFLQGTWSQLNGALRKHMLCFSLAECWKFSFPEQVDVRQGHQAARWVCDRVSKGNGEGKQTTVLHLSQFDLPIHTWKSVSPFLILPGMFLKEHMGMSPLILP